MGIIITAIVLEIVGIIWYIIGEKRNSWSEVHHFGLFMAIIGGIIAFSCFATLVTINKDFEKKIEDYHALKELIEYQRSADLSEFERMKLIEMIHENNKVINKHKVYHDNIWVGLWNSKEIGELEHLK